MIHVKKLKNSIIGLQLLKNFTKKFKILFFGPFLEAEAWALAVKISQSLRTKNVSKESAFFKTGLKSVFAYFDFAPP
jgi:hypothetical protein